LAFAGAVRWALKYSCGGDLSESEVPREMAGYGDWWMSIPAGIWDRRSVT